MANTWYVLLHTAGPAVPAGSSVGEQPGIAEHFAFLARRADAGQLVAAGPFGDSLDDGMTVLDVESLEEAERLAREDDQAVVSGVLDVAVRTWNVRMSRV
ncbi:MAG TPA: YciI family protein [Jatrophihabitantaceae bacterium]|nr:YciI family protein [Jatrophihabitantaceae bacterium]